MSGCGPGTLIGLLEDRFISTGIEISTTEIAYARREYESESKRFLAIAARALPDGCRDYGVATVVEVVEHLAPANLDDVLRATVERLRPGGKLVVTTPNFRSAWPLVERSATAPARWSTPRSTSTGARRACCGNCWGSSG